MPTVLVTSTETAHMCLSHDDIEVLLDGKRGIHRQQPRTQ
jgi:hypothetical protein